MAENFQDKLIKAYSYKEYDISVPVVITRWEIMQIQSLNKRYLKVYFQKMKNTVKELKIDVKCYTELGREETLTDIKLQELDKTGINFSKMVPFNTQVNNVEVKIKQCVLLDNTVIEPKENQTVENSFKPFNAKELKAGSKLLPSAKGYPVSTETHWICACGTINEASATNCKCCKSDKGTVFETITKKNVQKEIESNETQKKQERVMLLNGFACILAFVMLISMSIPIATYRWDETLSGFKSLSFKSPDDLLDHWAGIPLLGSISLIQLLTTCALIGLNIFAIAKNQNKSNLIANITVGIFIFFTVYYALMGVYFDIVFYVIEIKSYFVLLLNIPFVIGYFVLKKNINKIVNRIKN